MFVMPLKMFVCASAGRNWAPPPRHLSEQVESGPPGRLLVVGLALTKETDDNRIS